MCTCIDFKTEDSYFGRTLDLEYRFDEKIVITPRNYLFNLRKEGSFKTKYAMIGIATVDHNYPLYAEAANEKGLAIAGLNFPNNAYYGKEQIGKINIAPFELIPWVLGNFESIQELKSIIYNINLINISFLESIPLTPLHWMISDGKECIVLEQMKDGMKIYSNPIGVLTNNPPFSYQLMNINNYISITPNVPQNQFSSQIQLTTYGQGMGAIGLPGDNSPTSRFVRAAFNKLNSVCEQDEKSSVSQFFHILDSVSMVKGSVITKDKECDITAYSCCINTTKGIYYYKTYNNNQITAIKMNDMNMNSNGLEIHDLIEKQQIKYIN